MDDKGAGGGMPLTPAQMAQMQAQMQVLLFKMFVTVVPNLRLGVIVSIFLKDANAANGNDECTNGTPDGELNFHRGFHELSSWQNHCFICFICIICFPLLGPGSPPVSFYARGCCPNVPGWR